jgi:NAD(P)-dependent dehydrogenase (short-subunit alcohol dehydrogenase family)
MSNNIEGKAVVITGASSGLGVTVPWSARSAIGKRCKWLIVKDPKPSTAAYEPEGREFESLRARRSHSAALIGSQSPRWRGGAARVR